MSRAGRSAWKGRNRKCEAGRAQRGEESEAGRAARGNVVGAEEMGVRWESGNVVDTEETMALVSWYLTGAGRGRCDAGVLGASGAAKRVVGEPKGARARLSLRAVGGD